jgi:hypothetical protein
LVGKVVQVMLSGCVGFGQEGYCVVEPGDLSGLMDRYEAGFRGSVDDGLPDFSAEGLVGIGRVGELRL